MIDNSVYEALPKFHQLEVNVLRGLQCKDVIAQTNIKTGSKLIKEVNVFGGKKKFVENGQLAILTVDGIDIAAGTKKSLAIVYTEPLLRFGRQVANYATDIDKENVRLVTLHLGDEWTTDIAPDALGYAEEIAAGHIAQLTGAQGYSHDDFFANDQLPDGTKAYHYVFLGE